MLRQVFIGWGRTGLMVVVVVSFMRWLPIVSPIRVHRLIWTFPSPMTGLTTLKASTGFTSKLSCFPSTVRHLASNLVAQKETSVVFLNSTFSLFSSLKFHKAVTNFEFNAEDPAHLPKAAF